MEQPQPGELPPIRANVDQLLQDLNQLAEFARPNEQRQQSGSSSQKAPCVVAKGQCCVSNYLSGFVSFWLSGHWRVQGSWVSA